MTRASLIVVAAAAAAMSLAACETDHYGEASAGQPLKHACRPGDTEAGTQSGLRCSPGSSTASPSGSDANVHGAASAGSAPARPRTQ